MDPSTHLRIADAHTGSEHKETSSVLALSTILLEISDMQENPLDEDARDILNECESILLEGISHYAGKATARITSERDT